jgi:hypothetical protein
MVPLVNYMFQAILPNDIILEISYFFLNLRKNDLNKVQFLYFLH